jgi:hypothetical protein
MIEIPAGDTGRGGEEFVFVALSFLGLSLAVPHAIIAPIKTIATIEIVNLSVFDT